MTCVDCQQERSDLGPAGNCGDCQQKRWEAHLERCRCVLEATAGKRPEAGTLRRRAWDLATATMVILATYHRPFFGLLDPVGRKKAGPP